ncbi:MAG: ABC transporter ATP-binding protein [Alphaproteobacteria bacterium]|nr:ABC transporter ATP-binding protein [Alphaproteobacteria bacterium]
MTLAAEGVVVRYGAHRVLDGVSIAAEPGVLLGLIGPNGAGKSTLLRVLAGIERPTAGRVTLDGAALETIPGAVRARRIAYLAQGSTVHWPLTVERLVALGRLPHRSRFGAETETDRAAIGRALAKTETAALRDRPVSSLSGGERMRALIARALVVDAAILLADEPVAGLDPYHQLQLLELLRTRADAGGAIVVVLHDLTLASRFCDRLALLDAGTRVASGAPDAVLSVANLARVYRISALTGTHDGTPYIVPVHRARDGGVRAGGGDGA